MKTKTKHFLIRVRAAFGIFFAIIRGEKGFYCGNKRLYVNCQKQNLIEGHEHLKAYHDSLIKYKSN